MASQIEKDSLRQLKRIEKELGAIKDRSADPKRAFLNGVLYGMGWFFGGVIAVALGGWVLSLLGIIPGLGELAVYLGSLADKLPSR